jgi:hypothetical protein
VAIPVWHNVLIAAKGIPKRMGPDRMPICKTMVPIALRLGDLVSITANAFHLDGRQAHAKPLGKRAGF